MARRLWNLNLVSHRLAVASAVVCLLVVACPQPVLGENYNNAREYNRARSGSYCEGLSPQHFIDMDHLMGRWYGVEVINHLDGAVMEQVYDTCVRIHLSEVTDEISTTEQYWRGDRDRDRDQGQGYHHNSHHNRYNRDQTRYLKLIWDEKDAALEYLLRYNLNHTGMWHSAAAQHGNLADRYYRQFSGTVQVIKAVGNHLVLTFCQTSPNNQIFTIILSRQPNILTYDEIKNVKNQLNYRQLPINSVRRVCLHGGASSLYSSKTVVLLLIASLCGIIRSVMGKGQ